MHFYNNYYNRFIMLYYIHERLINYIQTLITPPRSLHRGCFISVKGALNKVREAAKKVFF